MEEAGHLAHGCGPPGSLGGGGAQGRAARLGAEGGDDRGGREGRAPTSEPGARRGRGGLAAPGAEGCAARPGSRWWRPGEEVPASRLTRRPPGPARAYLQRSRAGSLGPPHTHVNLAREAEKPHPAPTPHPAAARPPAPTCAGPPPAPLARPGLLPRAIPRGLGAPAGSRDRFSVPASPQPDSRNRHPQEAQP